MRVFITRYAIPLLISIAVIISSILLVVPVYLLLLMVVSYLAWFLVAYYRHKTTPLLQSEERVVLSEEDKLMEARNFDYVDRYYFRLLLSLNESTALLAGHLPKVLILLGRMEEQIEYAGDLAKNTSLMAVNAMVSAARCGEVGRGFVSASQDLAGISARAESDLSRLTNLVQGLEKGLKDIKPLPGNAGVEWVRAKIQDTQPAISLEQCAMLHVNIATGLSILSDLYEKYESTSQLDARWFKLGDTIRRVIIGLKDSLSSLMCIVESMMTDVQLLRLSENLSKQQLVEIHEGFLHFVEHQDKMGEIIS